MPTPIAHSLLGATIVAFLYPKTNKRLLIILGLGAFLANTPDFDFVLVFLLGSKDWHRGFSHSILFAVIIFFAIWGSTKFGKIRESAILGLVFASHFVLDFVTTKFGQGLELFWFFDSGRFGLGWFGLSEHPSKMSPLEIVLAILFELAIFTPILGIALYFRNNYFQLNKPSEF